MKRVHHHDQQGKLNWYVLALLVTLTLASTLSTLPRVTGDVAGASIVSNDTETITPSNAGSSTTVGGSFTTLILNATTQTPRWKAYVGNVTGKMALRNTQNYTLYDWTLSSMSGEVFATRDSVTWSNLSCAQNDSITTEENVLNITSTSADSINATFAQKVHRGFWVGSTQFTNSGCRAIATYVNSTAQAAGENADFQEVLLESTGGVLVFTALIDDNTKGFDNENYDFQIIVPEDEYAQTPHTYYFWMELS